MSNIPLVTAVMVTGKDPERAPYALAAVQSFLSQTWPNKELVIINDGKVPLLPFLSTSLPPGTDIRESTFPSGAYTLGDLRNKGLEKADGEWVIQWDDDDWYHPWRIAMQMDEAVDDHAVLLKCQVRYSFPNDSAKAFRWPYKPNPAIPGTVLHPNKPGLAYRSERKAEDDHFLQDHFKDKMIVLDNAANPHLYLRFFTGHNTWDHFHVMGLHANPDHKGRWTLPEESSDYLRTVIDTHYKFAVS